MFLHVRYYRLYVIKTINNNEPGLYLYLCVSAKRAKLKKMRFWDIKPTRVTFRALSVGIRTNLLSRFFLSEYANYYRALIELKPSFETFFWLSWKMVRIEFGPFSTHTERYCHLWVVCTELSSTFLSTKCFFRRCWNSWPWTISFSQCSSQPLQKCISEWVITGQKV